MNENYWLWIGLNLARKRDLKRHLFQLRPNNAAIRSLYRPGGRKRAFQAAANGFLLENQKVLRELCVEKSNSYVRIVEAVGRELLPLQEEFFQKTGDRIAPLPMVPDFFGKKIPERATVAIWKILQSDPFADRVSEIFKNSTFMQGDFFYRSDFSGGRLVMAGEDSNTIRSLGGIAHELGHCVAEWEKPAGCFSEQVVSEALAQTLEAKVVRLFLDEGEKRELDVHVERTDALNYYFCIWEFLQSGGVLAGWNGWENFDIDFFDRALLVVRETLFTCPGYQAVYAAASLIRRSIGRRGRANVSKF